MEKLLFIYNPRSGKGQIKGSLSPILEILSGSGYDVTVYPTKKQMDACETVAQRAGEFDLIACCGGDGTLDEVATGVMRSGVQRTVGYIPAGSTNDFANSLGLPKSMRQAARVVAEGAPFACDLGQLNDDYFVYVAAFGMFTDVSYQTSQDLKNALGHLAYLLEGMKRLGSWKGVQLHVESEEYQEEGEFVFGMVTNSTSVGGVKGLPGKDIELNDGLFEVILVHMPQNQAEWLEAITAVLMHTESRIVKRFKTDHMVVTSGDPVAWTRDGEDGGEHTRVELTNLRQRLSIMVGAQAGPALGPKPEAQADLEGEADQNGSGMNATE